MKPFALNRPLYNNVQIIVICPTHIVCPTRPDVFYGRHRVDRAISNPTDQARHRAFGFGGGDQSDKIFVILKMVFHQNLT